MGLYNVVAPCVVGNLHYTRPTAAPIEVDDNVARPLVRDGALTRVDTVPAGKPPADSTNKELAAWLLENGAREDGAPFADAELKGLNKADLLRLVESSPE